MAKNGTSARSKKRDTPKPVNFLNINGIALSLGDLRKADFSAITDPKASVNSLREWAIQLNNILRGFAEGS